MEDTKKVGLFKAFYNVGESMTSASETTDDKVTWDDLKKEDFEYAGVNEEEQKELSSSLEKIKFAVTKFFENVKTKTKKVVNKIRETGKSKNTTQQKIKLENNKQVEQKDEKDEMDLGK